MATDRPDVKRLVKVIVASPDRARVLARPGALAGWHLPAVAVDGPRRDADDWTRNDLERVAVVVGGLATPSGRVDEEAWEFTATGRVSAAGRTWIPAVDADRFGSDARSVRRWARRGAGPSSEPPPPR